MTFTNLYLNSTINNKNTPARKHFLPYLFLFLVTYLSPATSSEVLVTRIQGEVSVKLPGFATQPKLLQGALLPNGAEVTDEVTGSQYWVLCPGSDLPIKIRPQVGEQQYCPQRYSRNMRGGSDNEVPFILLPNQFALGKLDRIIWSGPKGHKYAITLYQYDGEGMEDVLKDWEPEGSTYLDSGVHELRLKEPIPLEFTDAVTYKLEVVNLDTSKSSAQFDEILIKPINQPPSNIIIEMGYSLLKGQQIDRHSALGNLVLAVYFADKGLRTEAYSLLSKLQDSRYRTQAQLVKARILSQPDAPEDITVKQYHKALEFAVADNDDLSAFIACRGVFSPSPLMLSNDGLALQKTIMDEPKFTRFCPKP